VDYLEQALRSDTVPENTTGVVLLRVNAWHSNDERAALQWGRWGLRTTQNCSVNRIFGPKKRQKQTEMGYEYTDSRNFGNTYF
jgi:hypothetical protein